MPWKKKKGYAKRTWKKRAWKKPIGRKVNPERVLKVMKYF